MQENYQTTRLPTVGTSQTIMGGASWFDPNNITADDGNEASIGLASSGGASLIGSDLNMPILPPGAVIDGLSVYIDSSFQFGQWGSITIDIGLPDTTGKNAIAVNGNYGGPSDLWGAESIDPADLADIELTLAAIGTVDDQIYVNYMSATIYWHLDLATAPADVPTRVDYHVYSSEGRYLGNLPNVSSPLAFPQDINSAGSTMEVICGKKAENTVTVSPILDSDSDEITDNNDLPILGTEIDNVLALGSSDEDALFKNGNRVKAWLYNYWHPNGKLMFSGQVNKVGFKYSAGDSTTRLTLWSDGLDLSNYIARGYPFSYTTDVSQTATTGSYPVTFASSGGWDTFGQTWLTGPSVTNIGAIVLRLKGSSPVTVSVYDAPNGNLIGSVTKTISAGSATNIQFEFPQLIEVSPSTQYFFAVWLPRGKKIDMWLNTANVYQNGERWRSEYDGGSGGGLFTSLGGELYFITKSGSPTTTATYTSKDPTTDMMAGILTDYNARGGYVTQRDFEATGLSLTYTFSMAFVLDAFKKVLELSPTGFYGYIDVGTSEMDIKQMSNGADYTVVRGKDVVELDLNLSIEQVKNYLLFTGGPAPTVNLYRDYQDNESAARYGLRSVPKTDNRVTLTATANAIGQTFIEENSDETQETTLTVPVTAMDHTLLTPGKTIGFRNFGNFIDQLVLQIVRREFNSKSVTLTLGRLPVRMNDEIQRINRGLLNEQTANNPNAPS